MDFFDVTTDRMRDRPTKGNRAGVMGRLQALGLGKFAIAGFDQCAATLAKTLSYPYGMVNLITDEQYFAGLYTPGMGDSGEVGQVRAIATHGPSVERTMRLDHGFCPHTVERRTPFPLGDVRDFTRFRSNPVVDMLGIQSYLGAPLIDSTNTVVGTVCVIDTQPHHLTKDDVAVIESVADKLVRVITAANADTAAIDSGASELARALSQSEVRWAR